MRKSWGVGFESVGGEAQEFRALREYVIFTGKCNFPLGLFLHLCFSFEAVLIRFPR
jgi:hypothetical protein